MTIYYYPPPMLLYLRYLREFFTTFNLFEALPAIMFGILASWVWSRTLRRQKPVLQPSNGLRTYVQCDKVYPRHWLIFSALQLRGQFKYLWRGHWNLPHRDIYQGLSLILYGAESYLRATTGTYLHDGIHTYHVYPWYLRAYATMLRSRGRIALQARISKIGTPLTKISLRGHHATQRLKKIRNASQTASRCNWKKAIFALFLLCTCAKATAKTQKQVYAATYKAESNDYAPNLAHFDAGAFDVLLDNCSNCTISPHKEDFTEIRDCNKADPISGVGSAKPEGIGTVHWKIMNHDGSYFDVVVDGALYVPSVEYRILSVTEWGRQRTARRKDGLRDRTKVLTLADDDKTVLTANRGGLRVYVNHRNGLPKARCYSRDIKEDLEAHFQCHECYTSLFQHVRQACKLEVSKKSQLKMVEPVIAKEPVVEKELQPTRKWPKLRIERAEKKDEVPKPTKETEKEPEPEESVTRKTKVRWKWKLNQGEPTEFSIYNKDLPPQPSILREAKYKVDVVELEPKPKEATKESEGDTAPKEDTPQVKVKAIPSLKSMPTLPNKLTPSQKLLAWHLRLGHVPFGILRHAAEEGILPKELAKAQLPACPSCMYGRQHRRPWRTKGAAGEIRKATFPGECVSVDQLESPIPGFVAQQTGKLTKKRYHVATVFVDHFSGYTYTHVHKSTDAEDAITAKRAFEQHARSLGVTERHYHADNGIFNSHKFEEEIEKCKQSITYCGVSAHHQSGIAEQRVRLLTEQARTQLLHAMHHNPKCVTVHLWPYALRHACDLFNSLPRLGKKNSPLALFTNSKVLPNLQQIHPFGCPVYVLEKDLADGSKIPKWDRRSKVGVYLGPSPVHASSVGLILNLATGLVSPQFHCLYDDFFETPKLDPLVTSHWQTLSKIQDDDPTEDYRPDHTEFNHDTSFDPNPHLFPDFDSYDPPPESEGEFDSSQSNQDEDDPDKYFEFENLIEEDEDRPLTRAQTRRLARQEHNRQRRQEIIARENEPPDPQQPEAPVAPPQEQGAPPEIGTLVEGLDESGVIHGEEPPTPARDYQNPGAEVETQNQPTIQDVEPGPAFQRVAEERAAPEPRRSSRNAPPPDRLTYRTFLSEYLPETFWTFTKNSSYALTQADPDTMTLKEAMRQPDADKFLEAMVKEVEDHVQRKHWRLVHNYELFNRDQQIKPIMAVWSMKRKRNPLGEIVKYKARLCAHGGMTEKGVHYDNTFAPVVTWTTVRFLLIQSLIHKWHTRQIDFVLAYPQAKVSHDLYMLVPEKFKVENGKLKLDQDAPSPWKQSHKLKLLQNLYGLKDAGATWYEHLKKGLFARGFTQSKVDPCLFFRKNLILVIYVDDCILMSPDSKEIDAFIADMQKDYTLEDEGDIGAYLGINVTRPTKDTIQLNQPALIKRIIDSLQLKDQRQHDTPADQTLTRDSDGPERKLDFHYRSLIGQLNYLTSTSRPDILFATHQCARFCNDPKLSHEIAAKRIVRYLKRTSDKGIIMKPDTTKGFECYVDADFAGTWTKEEAHRPEGCLSRTGYVIFYAGCPIIWSSKMQNTIALSTTEAEYTALSASLREVIYLLNLVKEFKEYGIEIPSPNVPKVTCRVFEDNVGALELANNPKLRPRTKHLSVQLHHFRHYVETKEIIIEKVATKHQLADIFTKPLPKDAFQYLRSRIVGW